MSTVTTFLTDSISTFTYKHTNTRDALLILSVPVCFFSPPQSTSLSESIPHFLLVSSFVFTYIVAGGVTYVFWSKRCQRIILGPIFFLCPCNSFILCLECLRTKDTFAEPVECYIHRPRKKSQRLLSTATEKWHTYNCKLQLKVKWQVSTVKTIQEDSSGHQIARQYKD